MINIRNQIPSIYYDASRDFQILGHLYEVVLNYTKTNVDMLYQLPNGIEEDTRATELLATTLGFKLKRNYDKAQLAALVSIFPQLLKSKGTKAAVDLAGNALVKASGVSGEFTSELEKQVLTIKIPIELSDITLFIDLLPYILPFGIRVSVVRVSIEKQKLSLPIAASTVMRKSLPGKDSTPIVQPLGLVKISEDSSKVEYSNANFINPTNNEAIAGLLGASPVIAFEPINQKSSDMSVEGKEETI